jgi:YidC/Oxa1 family membrane protein insertase
MSGWFVVVDFVRALVFAAAHVCGNSLGGGILAFSLAVRIALLPLTLRIARNGLAHQRKLAALAPGLAALKKRHPADPAKLAEATLALHREHGVEIMPRGTFGAALVQVPIGSAIYSALHTGLRARSAFLWMTDLTRPDAIVATGAAVLAGLAAAATPGPTNRSAVAASTLITLLFAWRISATVGLYWLTSNAVGLVQSYILRRTSPA